MQKSKKNPTVWLVKLSARRKINKRYGTFKSKNIFFSIWTYKCILFMNAHALYCFSQNQRSSNTTLWKFYAIIKLNTTCQCIIFERVCIFLVTVLLFTLKNPPTSSTSKYNSNTIADLVYNMHNESTVALTISNLLYTYA